MGFRCVEGNRARRPWRSWLSSESFPAERFSDANTHTSAVLNCSVVVTGQAPRRAGGQDGGQHLPPSYSARARPRGMLVLHAVLAEVWPCLQRTRAGPGGLRVSETEKPRQVQAKERKETAHPLPGGPRPGSPEKDATLGSA